jgi:hypothetical protein
MKNRKEEAWTQYSFPPSWNKVEAILCTIFTNYIKSKHNVNVMQASVFHFWNYSGAFSEMLSLRSSLLCFVMRRMLVGVYQGLGTVYHVPKSL